jgi:hypothetical protein
MRLMAWKRFWTGALLVMLSVYAAGTLWVYREMDRAAVPQTPEQMAPVVPAEVQFSDASPWARPGLEKIAARVEQFQLAGTFQTFSYPGEGQEPVETALALVDDLEAHTQKIVREGDEVGPFTVALIGRDSVQLRHGDEVWTLQLSGRLFRGDSTAGIRGDESGLNRFADLPVLETTAFGKRVAENQWVLDRVKVKQYAYDIANSPIRAANLYRSFDQVADEEDQEEAGFRLRMKGERDFFADLGLTDQDVIRKVNSMRMKNTRRAEYLISEFMKDRMGMVVLDVERNGEMRKMMYIFDE